MCRVKPGQTQWVFLQPRMGTHRLVPSPMLPVTNLTPPADVDVIRLLTSRGCPFQQDQSYVR